jgi:hypothetical protein
MKGRGDDALKLRRKKGLTKAVAIALTAALAFGGLPTASPVAKAASGTPGGIDAAGLRLWLKPDPASVTLVDDSVTVWKDSSPNGNDFVNDGSITAIAARPKPKYVPTNNALNFQPSIKFVRSGGSILQDINGLFASGEIVDSTSLFTVTGGAPSMANSSVFYQPLTSGGLGAHIPHTSGATAGKGNVLWDVGASTTRLTAFNVVTPVDYSLWGLHFDANPTVGSSVYQSIVRDGKPEAQTTQSRSPLVGLAGSAASLGSAAGGGSGYDGSMGELILFTDPLSASQKRQVETYLAIKYGLTLKEGSYLAAGPAAQIVWDADSNNGYNNHIAGIGLDQLGALDQRQGRSSLGAAGEQVILTANQALSDKQYLIWGDNGSTDQAIPYGTGFKRLSRTWKVQNTGNIGQVQIAIPTGMIPLGGVLLTSDTGTFDHATAMPLTEATLHGAPYYTANATLGNGAYFTFAEQLPSVQLSHLEIRNGAQNALTGFEPGKTVGYSAIVPQETDKVHVAAQASDGVAVTMTLTNYLHSNAPIADPTQVQLLPGVNKLKIELASGSSNNVYYADIIRRLAIAPDGQIVLHAGSVTASTYQANTTYVPANVVDGDWENTESRWSASGQGQWLQFDLGQPQAVTYLKAAFLNARERMSTFEILESNDPDFAASTVLLAKRKSRALLPADSMIQPYVFDKPSSARYLRLVGYGNSATGSSGNWNSLSEIALFTGTPPVIVEPEAPAGPPQAGDTPESPAPVFKVIKVSTAVELQTALDQAQPGNEIRLMNGSYEQNGPFVMKDKQGTAALPIRITAEEQGKAVIKGNSYLHLENSKYVEISGLVFNSAIGTPGLDYRGVDAVLAAVLKGENPETKEIGPHQQVHPGIELHHSSNISILRNKFALDETGQPYRFNAPEGVGQVWCLTGVPNSCRIGGGDLYIEDRPVYTGDTPHTKSTLVTDNGTHRHFIRVEGISSHNRIAYNDIGPKKGFGATITYNGQEGQTVSQYDVIEHNYFHGIGPRVTNGLEVIRLGLSGLSLASGYVTIQYNLFEGLNAEDEIISVKSSDNVVRYNTIRNSFGGIVARHGHRNSFYGNFIIGDGKTPGLSGFRIYGNDHKIYNNYMEGLTTQVIRLDGGTHDPGPDGGTNPTVKWMEGSTEQTAVLKTLPAEKQTEILRGHWRQYNVQIFNNTMVNTGNNATGFNFGGRVYQPVGAKVYNNVVFSNEGTIFNESTAAQNAPENERQIYAGNLVDGIANPTSITNAARVSASAIEKKPLQLVRSADGLIRLSATSPAVDASKAPFLPQDDIDGQPRYHMPDAGADEYNRGADAVRRPLTAAEVGPNAGRTAETGESPIDLIRFTQDTYSLKVHDSLAAVLNAVYQDSSKPVTGAAFFTANPEIASVNAQGVLYGVARGTTVVVATYNNLNAKATVIVTDDTAEAEAGLSALELQPLQTLTPVFDPVKSLYQVTVPYHVNRLALVPTAISDSSQITVSIDGTNSHTVTSGQSSRTLDIAEDGSLIWMDVSLPSGRNKVYTLIVKRLKAAPGPSDGGSPNPSPTPTPPPSPAPTPAPVPAPDKPKPSEQPAPFADAGKHWAGDMIFQAAAMGIVQGYPDGSFKPDEPMTRLQFAALLVRSLKLTAAAPSAAYADQSEIPDWALGEVAAAIQAEILQGYEDDTLRPNKEISRAEMITMLMRAHKLSTTDPAASVSFADGAEIPDWAWTSISQAVSLGLVNGKGDNRFAPKDTATRAEAVAVLIRLLELNKK